MSNSVINFPLSAQKEIDKLYKGRKHVELTIGLLDDDGMKIVAYDPERKVKEDASAVYPVGSICKVFTTSLMAKMVADGKLDIHVPISEYIPGLPERYYPSLEKLATHTSGFTTQPWNFWTTLPFLLKMNQEGGLFHTNPHRGIPDEEGMLRIIRETKLEDKPYKFVYSNIGMSILGYITGKAASAAADAPAAADQFSGASSASAAPADKPGGEYFWDSLDQYIREDLGLKHTFLGNVDMIGYDRKDQPCRCWQWEYGDIIAPAGALNATVEDLLTFAQKHMDGSLPYTSICHEVHGPCEKNANSGLAWRLEKDAPISWHGGNAGAFSAFLGFNRETGKAVAVAVNYGLVNAEQIGFALLKG